MMHRRLGLEPDGTIRPWKPAEVVARTRDAYSIDRFGSWLACARLLRDRGYTALEAEVILRSKIMRWAADHSQDDGRRYGRATAKDLARYLDQQRPAFFDGLFAEVAP